VDRVTNTQLAERLQGCPQLEGIPLDQLTWMAEHGRWERFEKGALLVSEGVPMHAVFFMLQGQFRFYLERAGLRNKVVEWHRGEFFGQAPYSRMVSAPGEGVFSEASEIVSIDEEHIPEMIRECHELTTKIVHDMIDRVRLFNSAGLHDEKMASLGKLAAGLAHELNNPSSAIARNAHNLADHQLETDEAAWALGAAGLTEAQIAATIAVRDSCLGTRLTSIRSPIEQADHEDEIADWLEDYRIDAALAGPLAESPITLQGLQGLAETLAGTELEMAIRWVSHSCKARSLTLEIGEAASRIHELVGAIKGYTHMDEARTPQPVDVGRGLSNTLAILEGKARERGVSVQLDLATNLPPVHGYGGELNQVWMNLIDNAIDASPAEGRVEIRAAIEWDKVVVRVIDHGVGIPDEALSSIFDPFFTTKGVGEGTGLGLDIVRRTVHAHDGEIGVESRAGRTEFRVAFPTVDEPGA
jgi:signal transduction histidine kinase